MRIVSAGHTVFAALMICIGIQGLITGEFTTVWQPVPKGVPAREVLAYLCALFSLASGIGLLWRRATGLAPPRAARVSRSLVAGVESARAFSRVPYRRFLEFRGHDGDGVGRVGTLLVVRDRLGPAARRFRDW
jgi:hypothetical protein